MQHQEHQTHHRESAIGQGEHPTVFSHTRADGYKQQGGHDTADGRDDQVSAKGQRGQAGGIADEIIDRREEEASKEQRAPPPELPIGVSPGYV